jgi:cell division protein FtsB
VDEREAVPKLPRLSPVRLIIILAAVAVGYFAFSAISDALLSQRLSQDEQQLHDQIDQLSQRQQELTAIRDYLKTDAYVEGVARQVLGLVRPGQTLFVVNSDAPPTPVPTPGAATNATPQTWWERLYTP